MKRNALILTVAAAFWTAGAFAADPETLTSLHAIHLLTNQQAARHYPVDFEATVTYDRGYERTIFVQDGDAAIYVQPGFETHFLPGDHVRIKGITQPSFRPFVQAVFIVLAAHQAPVKPVSASWDQLISSQRDCQLVTVRGVVRNADLVLSSDIPSISLQIGTAGGSVDVVVDSDDTRTVNDLLDAEVEVTGVASGRFDGKMQITGILLHVSSTADIKILKPAARSPWDLPETAMDEILSGYRLSDQTRRIRVHGTITYFQPGSAAVLQSGGKSLWLTTQSVAPLRVGDLADATGFPDVHDGFLVLTNSEIRDSLQPAPVSPEPVDILQLSTSKKLFDLVSTEAVVVAAVRGAAQDEYVLEADGQLFSAIHKRPPTASLHPSPPPPMKQIQPGAKVHVTGICVLDSANPFDTQVTFNLLLRNFDDITVVAQPPWLSVSNLVRLVSLLLAAVLAMTVWSWTLRRKVTRQTAALTRSIEAEAAVERRNAQLEARRSRILEDINGSKPLAEIIEQITEMISLRLGGVPCWCDIAGGARLGQTPVDLTAHHIVREEVPARSGAPLGILLAALGLNSIAGPAEASALESGARLAALAIETRRLYSDLVHRSEFDLLTDSHNRFSLDKHLERCISEARENASIFGLIYVDLNAFKQVNDLYGHHAGDLYLQEVALRMKRQLRTGDLLARIGGDEFAALVPVVHSRADVEEIALRLEGCFEGPVIVDGHELSGSASVGIALYPEDGATRDSLLRTADAAMYQVKHAKAKAKSKAVVTPASQLAAEHIPIP